MPDSYASNEGMRILDGFVCRAIPDPSVTVPTRDVTAETSNSAQPVAVAEMPRRGYWNTLRLVALVSALLVVNIGIANLRHLPPPAGGSSLWAFAQGWNCFPVVLLALWLTWGGGVLLIRLILVLLVAALGAGLTTLGQPRFAGDELFQTFIGAVVVSFLVVLGLNALMMPVQGYLHWEFGFTAREQAVIKRRGAKWSLFHIMTFTAFAASALAFARLYDLWMTNISGGPPGWDWLFLFGRTAYALVAGIAAVWWCFFDTPAWYWRVLALPGVLLVFVLSSVVFAVAAGAGPLSWDLSLPYLGLTSAACFNLGIIRWSGVRLQRGLPTTSDPANATARSTPTA